ncbi:monovalent cation:proton antiporter family protein [Bacillus sp. 165]|uniref:monovalent cation:proton antiporter family protein n=1 Tax=Bacillus sp. 165 TaxID=1529117 RepID=UPI001ADCB756|nr:monovalent cation:proton antiporter family protein [Bacillus sp. 165]MBO9129386.1 monovalent cation:proton antiporter family protein [Bacillus sp. 165]
MEHGYSVTSLMIVTAVAFFIPILLHRFKIHIIPVVVAEIIAGMIIGKSGFHIVHQDEWLNVMSTFGIIFLMFLSGLEIDFTLFKSKHGKKHGSVPRLPFVASGVFVLILSVSFACSLVFQWLGWIDNVFLMTLIISTISLGVVVPTLKEKNMEKTEIGQFILLVTVIADLATMVLLAVFVSLYSEEGKNTAMLLLLFAAGAILYAIAKRAKTGHIFEKLSSGSVQLDTRAVFALIIVLVGLSETVGAENILGAFLAGALLSLLVPNEDLVKKMDSIGYGFFIPIFFVMVGVKMDLWSLFEKKAALLLIPFLLIAFFISKAVPMLVMKKWYTNAIVIPTTFLLTAKLSLVIAASSIGEKMGILSEEMSSALILSAIISCIVSPILFKKWFPPIEKKRKTLHIVGGNRITFPLMEDFKKDGYDVLMFDDIENERNETDDIGNVCILDSINPESVESQGGFKADILVIATSDDTVNYELAARAKERGVDRVIVRIEDIQFHKQLIEKEYVVFSTVNSTKTLVRMLVANKSLVQLIQSEEKLHEIKISNMEYEGKRIRDIKELGDTLIVQIYREDSFIIPHGNTTLKRDDVLLVTGSQDSIDEIKQAF